MYGNDEHILNKNYKLRSMIRGYSNRDAYHATFEVACDNKSYNPVVIYGNKGLGKTYLLHAIANETFYEGGLRGISYKRCDELMDEIKNEKFTDLLVDHYMQ